MPLFGEKTKRMSFVLHGEFSMELCGRKLMSSVTGDIAVKILSESGIAWQA